MTTARRRRSSSQAQTGGDTDYRSELWRMADALRGSMDAAEYKHVVLGLIFLKYISDAFEERRAQVLDEWGEEAAEDRDEYVAENIFWVPPEARWHRLQAQARQPEIGRAVDDAMSAIERDNPSLNGRAPQGLRPPRAGQDPPRPGGRRREQHQGGRRRRPRHRRARQRLRVLPGAVRHRRGTQGRRVLHPPQRRSPARRDAPTLPRPRLRPLLRLVRHVRAVRGVHPRPRQRQRQREQGQGRHIHLRPGVQLHHMAYGQDEPRHPRHRGPDRARRQLPQRPPPRPARRLHPRQSALQRLRLGRGRLRDDRLRATPTSPGCSTSCTTSPRAASPASCSPTAPCRRASPARATSARASSRPAWWTASSPCPASSSAPPRYPLASGSCAGAAPTAATKRSSSTPAAWATWSTAPAATCPPRTSPASPTPTTPGGAQDGDAEYADVPGFCKSATLEDIRKHGHVLTPGRYVGAAPREDDGEPFADKMARLSAQWREQQAEARRLDAEIEANLKRLGFGS